jgi:hypothetical protein
LRNPALFGSRELRQMLLLRGQQTIRQPARDGRIACALAGV